MWPWAKQSALQVFRRPVVHKARFLAAGRTSGSFSSISSFSCWNIALMYDLLLENDVHVRRFPAKQAPNSYIKPVFQHELLEMQENAFDVRVMTANWRTVVLMRDFAKAQPLRATRGRAPRRYDPPRVHRVLRRPVRPDTWPEIPRDSTAQKPPIRAAFSFLERATGLEPANTSLGSWGLTTWRCPRSTRNDNVLFTALHEYVTNCENIPCMP